MVYTDINTKSNINFRKRHPAIYWAPRILSILFILFISLFALDIFDMKLGLWGTIVGLFMHLIPSMILTVTLIISWKYEWVGGTLFALGGLFYISSVIFNSLDWTIKISWSLTIAGPALIISGLFFANWFMKKNKRKKN